MSLHTFLVAPNVRAALVPSVIAAVLFFYFFPLFARMFLLVPLPGISDIVWAVARFPIQLLGLDLPKNDKAGYTVVIAARFYAPIVFLLVFAIMVRLGHKRHAT